VAWSVSGHTVPESVTFRDRWKSNESASGHTLPESVMFRDR
jgi:hypothetical protein